MFNLKTVNDVYTLTVRYDAEKQHANEDSEKLEKFLEDKSKEACDKIDNVAKTWPSTKKGFLSTCQSMIGKWMSGHIFSLITKTDITLDDKKNPIALFIITRDYDKSDNVIAGLFLNWVYRQFLEKAEKAERKDGISGGRPIHFLLLKHMAWFQDLNSLKPRKFQTFHHHKRRVFLLSFAVVCQYILPPLEFAVQERG